MAHFHPWPAVAVAAGLALAAAPAAPAQQAVPDRSCTLRLQPTDSTESLSRKVGEGTYVTHIRNGMRWLCNPATMTADSAVQYEARQTVVMIGSVHYRDTIRDLRSRRLTYYETDDRVVTEDSVRLRQLETGSLLRGPHVQFYNAVRGEGTPRTVATRRPRMRIPAPGDTAGDPFRITADTAVLIGEREAEARGDVVVLRDSLTAHGGYARFNVQDGSGFLTRSPSVEGQDFRLTGDTVRIAFEGSELRSVRAVGHGHLSGEEVDVRAPNVDVLVAEEKVDELWAYGGGPAQAVSAEQEIHGDSLHFSFDGGRLTGIAAVGEALAMQVLPGDTTPEAEAAPPDTTPEVEAAPPDTTPADEAAAPDTTPEVGAAPPDTAPEAEAAPPDTTPADEAAAPDTPPEVGAAPPDTAPEAEAAPPDTTPADEAAAPDTTPEVGAAPPDTTPEVEAAPPDTTPADDSARTQIQHLVAKGNARSFYRIPREDAGGEAGEAAGGREQRLALNYVIGDQITIRFQAGEPLSVHATRAIGLFLDPVEGAPAAPPPSDTTAEDTVAVDTAAGNTVAVDTAAEDTVAADTAAEDTVAVDTTAEDTVAADTAAGNTVAADTAAEDTVAVDTTAGDTVAADTASDTGGSRRPGPDLLRNWIAGDTVRAIFSGARRTIDQEPARPDSMDMDAATISGDSTAVDSVSADTAKSRGTDAPADSAAAASGDSVTIPAGDTVPAADSTRTQIQRLVAEGNARSFYRIPRENAGGEAGGRTDPPTADPASPRRPSRHGHGASRTSRRRSRGTLRRGTGSIRTGGMIYD